MKQNSAIKAVHLTPARVSEADRLAAVLRRIRDLPLHAGDDSRNAAALSMAKQLASEALA